MNARETRLDGHVRTGSLPQSLEFVSPFRRVFPLLFRLVRSSPVFFRRGVNIRRLHVQRVYDRVLSIRSKSTPVGRAARARNGRAPRRARTVGGTYVAGTQEVSSQSPGVKTEGSVAAMAKSETPAGVCIKKFGHGRGGEEAGGRGGGSRGGSGGAKNHGRGESAKTRHRRNAESGNP